MTMMPLELIEQLPPEIDPGAVVDHVYVGHAPGGGFGETHLVSHGGQLHVFGRSSMLSKFERLPLAAGASPRLERGSFNSTLHVVTPHGNARIVLSMFEVDAAAALVRAIHPEAVPPDPDASEAPSAASPTPPKPSKRRRKEARQAEPPSVPPAKPPAKPPPALPAMPPPKPSPAPPMRTGSGGDTQADVARYERTLERHPHDVVVSLSL